MEHAALPAGFATYRLPRRGQADAAQPAESLKAELDPVLLDQNARWFCRLRWGVAAAFVAVAIIGQMPWVQRIAGVHIALDWPLAVAGLLAALNLVYRRAIPAGEASLPTASRIVAMRRILWAQISIDLIILTGVIHCVGSTGTAAPIMYLFHVILACIFFAPVESLSVTAVAAALYLGLIAAESTSMLAPKTIFLAQSPVVPDRAFFLRQLLPMLAAWGVIWYLASRLSAALKHREEELAAANVRLLASAEERSRHMLQTTHQLKAPFAAIQANAQLLLSGSSGTLNDSAREVVERISVRAATLSQQILQMLQLANLRSAAQPDPPVVDLDLAEVLRAAVARVEPAATLRKVAIEADLEPCPIRGVEDHLRMLIDNVLANAVHYSHDEGKVQIACRAESDQAASVVIRDNGIGIAAEKLPHIFEDYYRTREAARHNKSSTGLGLAIVAHIARTWDIDVEVASSPDCGTRFSLHIPRHFVKERA